MGRIKIFQGSGSNDLQKKIDKWLETENVVVLSTSISMGITSNGVLVSIISIVYKDKG